MPSMNSVQNRDSDSSFFTLETVQKNLRNHQEKDKSPTWDMKTLFNSFFFFPFFFSYVQNVTGLFTLEF